MADGCRLYIITPEKLDLRTFPDLFARALDAGDVAAVQLRLKNIPDDDWKRAVDALRPIAQAEILESWSRQSTVSSCAIGGITAANLAPLVRAGANLLAIIGGVWNHPDGPAAGVRAINAAIKAARAISERPGNPTKP